MEIKDDKQFNQGIGKYKLLSSTAGVGSIVATKWGGFVMPLSTSKWKNVSVVTEYLEEHKDEPLNPTKILEDKGVELVEDDRFVNFLRSDKAEGMTNLRCLVAIPHISLDAYNRCDIKNHPINKRYCDKHSESGDGLSESMFTVPAVVFPRWFFSRSPSRLLKPVEEWEKIWVKNNCNGGELRYFAPPRDPYLTTNRKLFNQYLPEDKQKIHELLEQVSMVFICPNGHISDVPWDRYFSAKLEQGNRVKEEGFDLFNYEGQPCPSPQSKDGKHELQWLENRSHAESFGMLKCKHCQQSVSLEGIMNLQPKCPGNRPWENKRDQVVCMQKTERTKMHWALVTSNSVYYAENFSSLYIPNIYLNGSSSLNDAMRKVLSLLENTWYPRYVERHHRMTKEEYANKCFCLEFESFAEFIVSRAGDGEVEISNSEAQKIISLFLGEDQEEQCDDLREQYRFTEFNVFQTNSKSLDGNDKLIFNDIELPQSLRTYFHKIQQINTLGISSTQINFSRVSMPQPELNDDGTINYPKRMKIFSGKSEDVLAIPATQSFGEGLFFSFNEETLKKWSDDNHDLFKHRYAEMKNHDETYQAIYQEMESGGIDKFLVLHTFSHILMKELEFSCGYPTASLSERLYFSERMCGVLIYTVDGAEGSMGGLVWQGQPDLMESIVRKAMQRAVNCTSDPICWENEDQLNYAACFSCAMVSETSCEKRNVGLDRRILVDKTFGYFRDLVYDN